MHFFTPLRLLTLSAAALLASCTSAPVNPAADAPLPDDFWIGITVLGPDRAPAAAAALPRALKPGRYVVEPDRYLRVSLGTGAKETAFPPRTRLLTSAEQLDLYRAATAAGFLDPAHPNIASGNGEMDPETIQGKTVYIITTHSAGRRELIVMEVDPECGAPCEKAKSVVDWMAGKAWMRAQPTGASNSPS